MPNYNYVVDSSFRPYSFQEMLQPLTIYKGEYDKTEAAYDDLANKANMFKYLEQVAEENPNSQAAKIYKGYADDMNKAFTDFSKNGLNMGNRRTLMNLKKRYQGEIGQLETADKALQKERDFRLQMRAKDPSMLYASEPTIDDFLNNKTPNLYNVSGEDLRKEGAQYAASASARIYGDTKINDTVSKYYQEFVQTQGYSPEKIAEFQSNLEAIPEFKKAVDDIMKARGVEDNLTGSNYDKARQSIINGIMEGALYKEARNIQRDYDVMTASERASNARALEGQKLQATMAGLVPDKTSPTGYRYDATQDPKHATDIWMYNVDNGRITGISDEYINYVRRGNVLPGRSNLKTDNNTKPANLSKSAADLIVNKGKTTTGELLVNNGDGTYTTTKLDLKKAFPIFHADAFRNDAENGFDLEAEDTFSSKPSEAEDYKYENLKSEKAKKQVRDYVRNLLPEVCENMSDEQIKKVVGIMEFKRDYDFASDNSFRLYIPGVDVEGKIKNVSAFNNFVGKLNNIIMEDIDMQNDGEHNGI